MQQQLPILELQYLDASGSKGTVLMRAPLGTTYAEMDDGAMALSSIIAPLTNAVLIRQRIIFKSVAVPQDVADVGSSIKRRGVFYFASDDDNSVTLVEVPGILDEMIETTGNGAGVLIDQSNGYISSLIATIIETPICDPFGVQMGHILAAYRQSRTQ
jgi:hypothetical protein